MTTMLPMVGGGATIHFNRAAYPPKGPDDYVMAGYRAVSPEYLATLGVPLRRGRMLSHRDREGAPLVVVINESRARQYFPDRDPLGQRIQLGTEPSPDFPSIEIVGAALRDRGAGPFDVCNRANLLGLAALLASYIPARRASRISPLAALGR